LYNKKKFRQHKKKKIETQIVYLADCRIIVFEQQQQQQQQQHKQNNKQTTCVTKQDVPKKKKNCHSKMQ